MKKPVFSAEVAGHDLLVVLVDDAKLYVPPPPWEGMEDEADDDESVFRLALTTAGGSLVVEPVASRLEIGGGAKATKNALASIAEEIAADMDNGKSAARALVAASWTAAD